MRIILVSIREAYSMASALNVEVVMKMPFRALWPCNAPANFWISGRPTVLSEEFALQGQRPGAIPAHGNAMGNGITMTIEG